MGMENLLNYYFIMKKRFVTVLLACSLAGGLFAQQPWFKDKDLTLTGAYYYPEHWDESQWERDFKQMHDLGFEFTHFAEFAWAQLEPEEGKYDFAWLDKAVALAAKYDLKVIMCTSTATPPVWLSRKYPEILIKNENGTVLDHGARQHASFASPVYRELAYKMIEKLAQHYGNDSRIIGWQLDNEPAVQFDYNPKAELAFRDFLREKYHHDIKALNDAWGTAFWSEVYSSFDEITLPKTAQMFMNHHQILDYRRFAASQTNDFLNEQCLLIKKYAKNQWVTTNYIPNYEEGHIGGSPALDFQSYTRYMVYGDNEGIGRRGYRVGNPLRIAFANDFFRPIQGTYGVMELQPGQVNWGSINPQPLPGAIRLWMWSVFAGGGDFICTYRYRQPLYGTEQYHYGIVGTDGTTVTPGGREYEQFMKEIRQLRGQVAAREVKPADYLARRTAILFNHENSWSIERQKQNRTWNTLGHIERPVTSEKISGQVIIIHLMNPSGFEHRTMSLVYEDGKNLNRVFPGSMLGTTAERIAYTVEREFFPFADYYIDLHCGDGFEGLVSYVYCLGNASDYVVKKSREMAEIAHVDLLVESQCNTSGAYNYAGSLGIPSILLERGHSSQWCQSLVDEDVHDVKNILRYLGVFKGQAHRHEKTPIDVSPAIYEDAPVEGCWYPTKQPGETFREGDVLGYIKDYFGNELFRCIARQDGIILYETISLCIMKDSPMVAYGTWDFTKHGEVVKNCIVCGEAEHKRHHHHKKSEIDED